MDAGATHFGRTGFWCVSLLFVMMCLTTSGPATKETDHVQSIFACGGC